MSFTSLDAKILYRCANKFDVDHVVKGISSSQNVIELYSRGADSAKLAVQTMRGYLLQEPQSVVRRWIDHQNQEVLFTQKYTGFIQTANYHAFCLKRIIDSTTCCAGIFVCQTGLQKSMPFSVFSTSTQDVLGYEIVDSLTVLHATTPLLSIDGSLAEFLKTYKEQ
jgi:hypothetical protein